MKERMQIFLTKNHRVLFYGTWLAINLVQSYYTELMDDEAFYWAYSRFPSFGYFEHPPLIAFFTGAGYWLFKSELGVRFFIVLLNTASIYIIRQLSEGKNDLLFYAIVLSISLTQLGGFIAAPDNILIFFTALFFLTFKGFVARMTVSNALQLGVVMALMLYSKYHGILVIIFTMLSFPKLALKYQTYIAVLVTTVLFLPHLYWQYKNDFDTLQYQLFERNFNHYRIDYTIGYILGQLLIAGPVMGGLLIWWACRSRVQSPLQRALKYCLVGIYVFFLLASFHGKIEPNWTIAAFIPLIVLSHEYLDQKVQLQKWVYKTVPFTLIVVVITRIAMATEIHFLGLDIKSEFYKNKTVANNILSKAGETPVVFINSYAGASKYWFYTGHASFSLNTAKYHRNSYNYWPMEDSLIGKPAYVIGLKNSVGNDPPDPTDDPVVKATKIDKYFSFSKIRFSNIKSVEIKNDSLQVKCSVQMPETYHSLLKEAPYDTASVYIACYFNNKDSISYVRTGLHLNEIAKETGQVSLSCCLNMPKMPSKLRIVVSTCLKNYCSINSNFFSL